MSLPPAPGLPAVTVLSLPGWQGSPADHWQMRWAEAFGDIVVTQHDWMTPRRGDWLARLEDVVLEDVVLKDVEHQQAGPVVLVAHSLGCQLAAQWALASNHASRIGAAFLVAPPDLDADTLPQELRPWRPTPQARLPFPTQLVASRDDPFCSWSRSRALADAWGAALTDAGPRGHLNAASGLGHWPEGRLWLSALRARVAAAAAGEPPTPKPRSTP